MPTCHPTFDFDIERYYLNGNSNPLTEAELPKDNSAEYDVITLTICGRVGGVGVDWDAEITSAIGPDGKNWQDKLTSDEVESIIECIGDNAEEDCPDSGYDYED